MAFPRENKKASQDAYREARKFGHTKEEARSLRDNWKPGKKTPSSNGNDNDDEYYCIEGDDEDYFVGDPDFD